MPHDKRLSMHVVMALLFRLGLVLMLLVLILPLSVVLVSSAPHVYPAGDVPDAPVALVFGAGLQRDGSPSPILRDRMNAAIDLYFTKKVKKLLLSGDNRFLDYNEPGAMGSYAIAKGVPAEDIVLDYAGRRTYDSCYRARFIFGVEDAILVTQRYHLSRAIFTCSQMGMRVNGVAADSDRFVPRLDWLVREGLAISTSVLDVWVTRPLPVLGDPEPIFP